MVPLVSICILVHDHPEVFVPCLESIYRHAKDPAHEVVVVSGGSMDENNQTLQELCTAGKVTTLVVEPENLLYSRGMNRCVQASDSRAPYIVLMDSDVEVLHPDILARFIAWAEGVPPYVVHANGRYPTKPSPGPRDIVSMGWVYDPSVEGSVRFDSFCCLVRRSKWRDFSPDFPVYFGMDEAFTGILRDGGRGGVLCRYHPYHRHKGNGSGGRDQAALALNKRMWDLPAWYSGVKVETLDFSLGPHEYEGLLDW